MTRVGLGRFASSLSLSRRSPLILGYSGWEGDVIMSALKRRLEGGRRLGHNIYWFCYTRAAINSLPKWLTDHGDVYFVVPPERAGSIALPQQHALESDLESYMEEVRQMRSTRIDGGEMEAPTLSAQLVLDALIKEFEIDAPLLTTDPLGFLAERIRRDL